MWGVLTHGQGMEMCVLLAAMPSGCLGQCKWVLGGTGSACGRTVVGIFGTVAKVQMEVTREDMGVLRMC